MLLLRTPSVAPCLLALRRCASAGSAAAPRRAGAAATAAGARRAMSGGHDHHDSTFEPPFHRLPLPSKPVRGRRRAAPRAGRGRASPPPHAARAALGRGRATP